MRSRCWLAVALLGLYTPAAWADGDVEPQALGEMFRAALAPAPAARRAGGFVNLEAQVLWAQLGLGRPEVAGPLVLRRPAPDGWGPLIDDYGQLQVWPEAIPNVATSAGGVWAPRLTWGSYDSDGVAHVWEFRFFRSGNTLWDFSCNFGRAGSGLMGYEWLGWSLGWRSELLGWDRLHPGVPGQYDRDEYSRTPEGLPLFEGPATSDEVVPLRRKGTLLATGVEAGIDWGPRWSSAGLQVICRTRVCPMAGVLWQTWSVGSRTATGKLTNSGTGGGVALLGGGADLGLAWSPPSFPNLVLSTGTHLDATFTVAGRRRGPISLFTESLFLSLGCRY